MTPTKETALDTLDNLWAHVPGHLSDDIYHQLRAALQTPPVPDEPNSEMIVAGYRALDCSVMTTENRRASCLKTSIPMVA